MEKLSRVKKYEQLRDSIANDGESRLTSKDLSQFQERLNRIDATQLDLVEQVIETEHDAAHLRRESYFQDVDVKVDESTERFANEYLDEALSDVKHYNQEKGYSHFDNTSDNIFEEIKPIKKEIDFKFIESLDDIMYTNGSDDLAEIPSFLSRSSEASSISKEVKNLLSEEPEVPENEFTFEIPSFVSKVTEYAYENEVEPIQNVELEKEKVLRDKLMVETQDLRNRLDDQEADLNEVSESVFRADRILNVVLIVLILATLIVCGVVAYWILLDKGII